MHVHTHTCIYTQSCTLTLYALTMQVRVYVRLLQMADIYFAITIAATVHFAQPDALKVHILCVIHAYLLKVPKQETCMKCSITSLYYYNHVHTGLKLCLGTS